MVAGIGNAIRSDDYVGVKIAEDLRRGLEAVQLIECETVPESFVDEIVEIDLPRSAHRRGHART